MPPAAEAAGVRFRFRIPFIYGLKAIAFGNESKEVREMLNSALLHVDPRFAIRIINPEETEDHMLLEKKGFTSETAAYLCADKKCLRFSSRDDFEKWKKKK